MSIQTASLKSSVRTVALVGVDAVLNEIQVDLATGKSDYAIVGLPERDIRESNAYVRSAIRASGFLNPDHQIRVTLSPADSWGMNSAARDLSIALGILVASGQIARPDTSDVLLFGSLSLNGTIHPLRGVLPAILAAQRHGIRRVLVSPDNAAEASVVSGVDVVPVQSLREAIDAIDHPVSARVYHAPAVERSLDDDYDLSDVRGQALARRALEIAAAGHHRLLIIGPPGAGKTMLARRLPGILPALSFEEALEATAVHSVAGQLDRTIGVLTARPFRAPHHTVSDIALVGGIGGGGGSDVRPGEVSLAHHGVLFLDELPEFSRRALGMLREPLDRGYVQVGRMTRTATLPARLLLVAAMNPCPCGYFEDPQRECRCTPLQMQQYQQRVSGRPMRDRFDLVVHLSRLPVRLLTTDEPGEPSSSVRARVEAARERQVARYAGAACPYNSALDGRHLRALGAPTSDALDLLARATDRFQLSARAYERILRVARTIADLDASGPITDDHVAEALAFR